MGHKFVADEKNVMSSTSSKGPPTLEQLAEIEQNVLNLLRKLEDELEKKQDKTGKQGEK